MNNWVFGKTMENARKRQNIKLVNYFVSEPNYYSMKWFPDKN